MTRGKKTSTFEWNGLYWTTRTKIGKEVLDIGIRAHENDHDVVVKLGDIAIRFSEFWELHKKSIVDATRQWLAKKGSKKDTRAQPCTETTVTLTGSGWTIGTFKKDTQERMYFELLMEFEDANGSVYGEGVNVKTVGVLNDDLTFNPKELDFQFLVL